MRKHMDKENAREEFHGSVISIQLQCLYELDALLGNTEGGEEETIRSLLKVIPGGWRYADICRVRICCNGITCQHDDFKNTELKLTAAIVVDSEKVGDITVAYIKPLRIEKGIFLADERSLINAIAARIGNFLLLHKLRRKISEIRSGSPDEVKTGSNELLSGWLRGLELTDAEIREFCRVKINFRKGETMCKQGMLTSFVMLLAEGYSKNYLEGYQGHGYNFSIVKPFDFIGLSSLFGSSLYNFSGAAITPCTVYIIENELFKAVAAANPRFTGHLLRWYCSTTERHLKRLSCIANKQAMGRIADILLYLKNDIFGGHTIRNIISRKDIAELAAMSTESAVRILSDMRKDKIISTSERGIDVLDEKVLHTLSYSG